MATQNEICTAIKNRKAVTFTYRNEGKTRTAELYRQGDNQTTKVPQVRAYQTSGHSESNTLGWKLFDIADIKGLKETKNDIKFPRKGYDPDKTPPDEDIYTHCQVR